MDFVHLHDLPAIFVGDGFERARLAEIEARCMGMSGCAGCSHQQASV
jgi:hypothetical protein